METVYKRDMSVPMSMCDFQGRLSIADTVGIFMDMATEVTELLDIGLTAMERDSFFWLTVRTRCRFHRRPKALEQITAATWAHAMQRAVCNRYYTLSQGEELLAEGKTEWMVLDKLTGGLAASLGPGFYSFPASDETVCDGKKTRVSRDFGGDKLLGLYSVRSTDIDIGHHMNNIAYIRAILGMVPTAELRELNIREFEAVYISPCLEGQELSIYRRDCEDGFELGLFRPDGQLAATAKVWAERAL